MEEKKTESNYHCKVYVVDEIMGGGKTSAAINFINALPDDVKVMYVTPFNSKEVGKPNEVGRIMKACWRKDFIEPHYLDGRKVNHLKQLIVEGRNIATTHVLFHLMAEDTELIEILKSQDYVLIMDEVTEVVTPYKDLTKKNDMDFLIKGVAETNPDTGEVTANRFVEIDESTHLLKWRNENYTGQKFSREKKLAQKNSLAFFGDNDKKGGIGLVELFPMSVFDAFNEAYILTYMFEAQLQAYYFKYFGLQYEYLYVKGDSHDSFEFTPNINERRDLRRNYRELITIYTDSKIEDIGKKRTALSLNWFKNNKNYNKHAIKRLKNSVYKFFRRGTKKGKGVTLNGKYYNGRLWTTFNDYKSCLKGEGYTNGFASINIRASNDYRHCTAVAYLANRFLNPVEAQFFRSHGIEVDEDGFALSEMLQFLWRSAIRDGKPIDVFIPSKRMRELLEKWIDENSTPPTSAKSA